MTIKHYISIMLISCASGLPLSAPAADLSFQETVPAPPDREPRGIWGAIAYSATDSRHGFFWGGDRREEAERQAIRHCERADGADCKPVTVFRNHRHWDDDDGTGFPYAHCGAIAVGVLKADGTAYWGAAAGETRAVAEEHALARCGGEKSGCEIREWVCT